MYDYNQERPGVLTERGQFELCEVLLDAQHLARANGLIPHDQLARHLPSGDSFHGLALVDRLVELGYLQIASREGMRQAWIYRWIARSRI
jgi:hypothetical protein